MILPQDNKADLAKLPEAVREDMTMSLVDCLEDVLAIALPTLNKHN